jgi:glycerophosphoryl diester phosphodiesterase
LLASMASLDLIAHRLGRAYGPDSSRAALEGSLGGPLYGLETDVCLTADGELVLLHDPLLPLCTDLSGWAHRTPAAWILAGELLDQRGEPSGQAPLTLDELLERVPDHLVLQLEVKAHADPELARRTTLALCRRLDAHGPGVRHRIEVIAFSAASCAIAAACGYQARLVLFADYTPAALAAWAARHRVSGVSIEHFLLSGPLVGTLRLAGLSVNTGTVNRAELLARALAFGPDAVCSDRPHELRAESKPHAGGVEVADEIAA